MKTLKYVVALVSAASLYATQSEPMQWTWFYQKVLGQQQREQNKNKSELSYGITTKSPFNQLLFCWNALRPLKGYFSFWVQVRDANSQKWSKWHRMSEWGAAVQRSYISNKDCCSRFVHVRLELEPAHKADAFSIKIMTHENASLELLHACSVCVSDFSKFATEVDLLNPEVLRSVHLSGVPALSQFEICHPRNDGLCSPTSCSILVSYLLRKTIDPIEFAQQSLDHGLDKYGSWPFNMAHAFERCDGKILFAAMRFNSFVDLLKHLKSGVPAVVSVRGKIEGAPKEYPQGHLMVVVGYDKKEGHVICHDCAAPSTDQTVRHYKLDQFLAAWERSHRLVYAAHPVIVSSACK